MLFVGITGSRETQNKGIVDKNVDTSFNEYPKSINISSPKNLKLRSCYDPLGMEHGYISDEDISASSAFDYKSVGPHNARYCLKMII